MSRALKFAAAVVVAAAVETACVWVLGHSDLHRSIIFATAFAAGYVTLFGCIGIMGPPTGNPSLGTQLRTYAPFGIAALLLAELIIYLCANLLGVFDLKTVNAAVLVAVVCWVALGWRFVGGAARQSPSGSGNRAEQE